MNNIDKQHSWDRIAELLVSRGIITDRDVIFGGAIAIETEIASLLTTRAAFLAIQTISDVPSDPPLFTDEQLAALKRLVSTAVWIRGEQLAHPNAHFRAHIRTDTAQFTGAFAEIDTHNLAITRIRSEFEAGQSLYTRLVTYCAEHGIDCPEWAK